MESSNVFDVTIVICTYNRAGLLRECLNSLVTQTADISLIPVIVVDNNSTYQTERAVREFRRRIPEVRYIFEPRQGLSYARNRGFSEAGTKWIAYLDDDARAFPDYLENMLKAVGRNEFDCIGGVYFPWYKYGRPKWFKDRYASNSGNSSGLLTEDFASGGNMIIKREVLERFKGFSGRVGMSGKRVAYGEETRLQVMMRREGLRIGFDSEIRISHLVPVYKQTPVWFIRSSFAVGKNFWDAFLVRCAFTRLIKMVVSNLARAFRAFVSNFIRLFCKRNYFLQNWFIDSLCPVAFIFGAFVGFLRCLITDAGKKRCMF